MTETDLTTSELAADIPSRRPTGLKLTLLPTGCIVLAGILAYLNSFRGVFVFDDIPTIVTSHHFHRFTPLKDVLWGPPQSTAAGRPVVGLSLALNYAVSGLETWSYHAFNLAVHLLAALALFGLLRRTLAMPSALGLSPSSAAGAALAVTLIWTVHPLQTEAVTYVIQRTELLMGLFYLLTLYCALRGWQSPARRAVWCATAVTACALGMLSKEVMVSAPLAVLLYDRAFVSGTFKTAVRRHWRLYLPLAATWGILAAIIAAGPRSDSIGFHHDLSPWHYLLTQASVIVHYLRLAILPYPLVISYHDWPIARSPVDVWPQALLVLTLLGATSAALVRKPALGFLGACFFMLLAPTSSFVPIVTEIAAERRMYLPLAAVIILAVIAARHLLAQTGRASTAVRIAGTLLIAAVVVLCIGATIDRNCDYRSPLVLWQDAVSKRPGNVQARANLGVALREADDLSAAQTQFKLALEIDPTYPPAVLGMATVHQKLAEWSDAVRLGRFLLRSQPHYLDARRHLIDCLLAWAEELTAQARPQEALDRMREAVSLAPGEPRLHNALGFALARRHRYGEAESCLREAVRLDPTLADGWMNLGFTLIALDRLDEGLAAVENGLRIKPDAHGHLALGDALAQAGRRSQAVQHYRQALQLDPSLDAARQRLEQSQ